MWIDVIVFGYNLRGRGKFGIAKLVVSIVICIKIEDID